jgi:outer membrane protein assembly factor BamA
MLGDHEIIFQTNLMLDLKNSDYGLSYFYLPGRIDWGFQGYHSARFVYIGDTLYRFQTWTLGAIASYPIDRFNRIDFSLSWMNLSRDDLDNPSPANQSRSFLLPTLTYVNDNSVWQGGWFAPNNGSRFFATVYGTPKFGPDGLNLLAGVADYRTYIRISRDFIMAWRASAGASIGSNAHRFFIGGTEGWINRSFSRGQIPIDNAEDFVFLTPVLPLRGYDYNVQNGTHYGIMNLEFRFPLVRYLIFGALPLGFQNILGTAFFDMGSAWNDTGRWRAFTTDPDGSTITNDLLMSTGVGTRLGFLGLPLRIDVAWRFKWGGGFSAPTYYFSLGADF